MWPRRIWDEVWMKHDDYENMQRRKFYQDNASHHAEVNGQKYNVFISSYLRKGKSNTLHHHPKVWWLLQCKIHQWRVWLWRLWRDVRIHFPAPGMIQLLGSLLTTGLLLMSVVDQIKREPSKREIGWWDYGGQNLELRCISKFNIQNQSLNLW